MARFNNVLLVEDDPITLMVCERIMKMNDFAAVVKSCENGELAIRFLSDLLQEDGTVPEIIFLDINMPVLDGWGFLEELERIRGSFVKLPRIFILSSTVDPEDYKKTSTYPA